MPANLISAYETLESDDKKLVEQLIYSLLEKVKNHSQQQNNDESQENLLSNLESLKGVLKDCKYNSVEEARADRIAEKYEKYGV